MVIELALKLESGLGIRDLFQASTEKREVHSGYKDGKRSGICTVHAIGPEHEKFRVSLMV